MLPIVGYIKASVKLGELNLVHEFIVVEELVSPVILGVDFLHANGLVLDFTNSEITIYQPVNKNTRDYSIPNAIIKEVKNIFNEAQKGYCKMCVIATIDTVEKDIVQECSIPSFQKSSCRIELPECPDDELMSIVKEHCHLFCTTPGLTDVAHHFITTTGSPVRVPPRRIPVHYREEVEKQIAEMLEQGVIIESSSPWMAPAVFVMKKSGDLRLCIDYRELNKKTKKDAYPLPLPDEVQNRLSGSTVFSTLDLQSGYWQLPVNEADQEKTAFVQGQEWGCSNLKECLLV